MRYLEADPSPETLSANLARLQENEYPGRVLIMGINSLGNKAIQAYALMGRSKGSRNRVFIEDRGNIRTVAPDKTEAEMHATENAELIYYRAMKWQKGVHVVSNGAQTDHVTERISAGDNLLTAITTAPKVHEIDLSQYEPDEPNYTPRITGVFDFREDAPTPFGLAVIRKLIDGTPLHSHWATHLHILPKGVGYGIQTYKGNGDPLPSFEDSPYAIPLGEGVEDIADNLWESLNSANRVAVVVKSIDRIMGEEAKLDNGGIEYHILP